MAAISKETGITLGLALTLALAIGGFMVLRSQVDDLRSKDKDSEVVHAQLSSAVSALAASSSKVDNDHEVRVRLLEEANRATSRDLGDMKADLKTLVNGLIRPAGGRQ